MTRNKYITDTCESNYKDMDGEILSKLSLDKGEYGDYLRYGNIGVMDIWDEEYEESCRIQEDNQCELIICRTI